VNSGKIGWCGLPHDPSSPKSAGKNNGGMPSGLRAFNGAICFNVIETSHLIKSPIKLPIIPKV